MKLVINNVFKDEYFKQYVLADNESVKSVFNTISLSGLEDIKIYVDEDVDTNLKSVQGSYSLQEILEDGNTMFDDVFDITCVTISTSGIINGEKVVLVLNPGTRTFTLVTKNKDLMLSEVLKNSKGNVR